jgi:hypothetical protein
VTRRRLGSRPRHTTTAFVCWILGALVGVLVVRAMLNGAMPVGPGLAGVAAVLAWLVLWWRIGRAGTFVGGGRVTARTVFRTRKVDLRNVTKVKAVPDRGTRRLVLDTKDGKHLFLPLRGYAVERADTGRRPGVLTAAEFDLVLKSLGGQGRRSAASPKQPEKKEKKPKREKPAPQPKEPDKPARPGFLYYRED